MSDEFNSLLLTLGIASLPVTAFSQFGAKADFKVRDPQLIGQTTSVRLPDGRGLSTYQEANLAGYSFAQPYLEEDKYTGTGNVYFDHDKDNISVNQLTEIQKLAAYLKTHPKATLELHAHTDKSGDTGYNQELSERRNKAYLNALIAVGVDPRRITLVTQATGEEDVPVSQQDGQRLPANRVVEARINYNTPSIQVIDSRVLDFSHNALANIVVSDIPPTSLQETAKKNLGENVKFKPADLTMTIDPSVTQLKPVTLMLESPESVKHLTFATRDVGDNRVYACQFTISADGKQVTLSKQDGLGGPWRPVVQFNSNYDLSEAAFGDLDKGVGKKIPLDTPYVAGLGANVSGYHIPPPPQQQPQQSQKTFNKN